jgi:hypothetical protein
MNPIPDLDATEQRIRHTLRAVAETVTKEASGTTLRSAGTSKAHRARRIALGAGVLAVPVALAAFANLREGSEYVDTIPPERVVMSGSVAGSRYLLIESDRIGECGEPVTGVELVEEDKNLLGSEWNTSGYEYGEHAEKTCGSVIDFSRYLKNPALFNDSGAAVGDSFVWVYAVHTDIDAVRITSDDYSEDLTVYQVDGAGYAPFEIPKGMTDYTSELVIDGRVVPGSETTQTVPQE